MGTADSEALGSAAGDHFNQMAFSIEKVTVTAKSRALKAEYSLELCTGSEGDSWSECTARVGKHSVN